MTMLAYSWDGASWTGVAVPFARLDDVKFALNRSGDAADPEVLARRDAYLSFDENNLVVHRWLSTDVGHRGEQEAKYPWLLDGSLRPADDPAARQAKLDALVADWTWRRFKAMREAQVRGIRAVRASDGVEFDGDETSQNRLARMVALGVYQALGVMIGALDVASGDGAITAAELAGVIRDALQDDLANNSQQWKTADNAVTNLNVPEAAELAIDAGGQQSAMWFEG